MQSGVCSRSDETTKGEAMNVVVTGASGFVGRWVMEELRVQEHLVLAVDVMDPPGLGRWWNSYSRSSVSVPLDSEWGLGGVFTGQDVVIHLAGMSNTGQCLKDPVGAWQTNVMGTAHVMEEARRAGVSRVFVAGSTLVSAIQAAGSPGQMLEGEDVVTVPVVTEETPVMTVMAHHPYVSSKAAAEMVALDFARTGGPEVTVFRFGILYGPWMTPGVLVHEFISRALSGRMLILDGTGQQWRQYMHVADLARAFTMAMREWKETSNQVFNVCPGSRVTVADMAEAVCKAVPGTQVEYGPARAGDIEVQFCSPQKAGRTFGWVPKIGLEEGVHGTVEWYRTNGDGAWRGGRGQ